MKKELPPIRGRVCAQCQKPLRKPNGEFDFDRYFCSSECYQKDNRERLALRRAERNIRGKCSTCGRRKPKARTAA